MPYLRVHEIDLYYEEHGDGPALVFAHGAGGNHLVWWQQVPAFARDYRVISFDHRAFGLSRDVPHGPGRRAFPLDLHALLDHLGVDEFAIVAHSMGGRTATPFLWLFPGRMRALVLSGTIGGALTDEVRAIQAAHAERVARRSMRSRALRPGAEREDPDRAHLFHAIGRLNPPRGPGFLAPSPGLSRWTGSTTPLLQRAGLPTLFLVGAHDMIVPAEAMRAAHRGLPGSRFAEIANAGHSAYFEQPEAYNRALRDFLDDVYPPTPSAQPTPHAPGRPA
ncbi:MAG: alpha/beta hydrolase [Chloroflexota bacterium]|nr:alpha/beta hydrolase [Chloroflexota bacterium]